MSTQPTPTAPRRCPRCGEPYTTKGPARRLEADGVTLGRYYRHTHAGRVFLHRIEHFDESSERPPIDSVLDLEGESDV
jgi:hypothetical protein